MTTQRAESPARERASEPDDITLARQFGLSGIRPAAGDSEDGSQAQARPDADQGRAPVEPAGTKDQGNRDDVLQLAHNFGLPGLRERSS